MTYKEIQDFIANDLLARDDAYLPARIRRAINHIHKDIQVYFDWRCMESDAALTYPANSLTGVATPADYKRAIALWSVISATSLRPILASTESEVNIVRGLSNREPGMPVVTTDAFHQRWYEYQGNIRLFVPPTTTSDLQLDYYAYLPDYAVDASTDFFSQHHYRILAYGAAAQVAETLDPVPMPQEQDEPKNRVTKLAPSEKAKFYLEKYEMLLAAANRADVKTKRGGLIRRYAPPIAGRI